jgi:hypothetical protein
MEIWVTDTQTGAKFKPIKSHPKKSSDLYEIVEALHGQKEATDYKIEFRSSDRREKLGHGRFTMPDTRPQTPQGQPQMYPPPYGYPQHPGPQQAAPQQQAPQNPQNPIYVQPAQGPDMGSMLAGMREMLETFQTFQQRMAPPQQPQPVQQPQQPFVMPQPPASADMGSMTAWMRECLDLFNQMQSALSRGGPQPQPQPQAPPQTPGPQGMPSFQPPAGTRWVWAPEAGWMALPINSGNGSPVYRGPRSPYYPQGAPHDEGPPRRAQYNPQEPPKSPVDVFREAASQMRAYRSVAEDFANVFGGGSRDEPPEVVSEDDDSPIKIIDTGHGKLAVNKEDGALRWAETGLMALPKVLEWMSEQREAIQTAAKERQAPRQKLPDGYVEIGPGYKPPPGYTAVPVDELPRPPEHVPPPIDEPQRQPWGAPTMPTDEDGE